MFKLNKQKKDHRFFCGNKYEKYSIKKLKVGAASVLVGTGFLFGYHVDQVSANEQNAETTAMVTSKDGAELPSADKSKGTAESKQENTQEVVTETLKPETKDEAVLATSPQVAETKETPETKEVSENKVNSVDKETVNSSTLLANLADLEAQIERIRGNKKQASQIQNAEKLAADARQYLEALDATQKEVDAKAKQISSLTSILKSIKAEATPKENKNQDSRNGKKMEEGTGFRTGVTEQALTGSIHFDDSKGPTEKQIPVANNGDGERVINMAITYSASSSETVTDGKVRVTIPKAFLHSTKKPEFKNSSFVKSVDDLSTTTNYVYDLNLNPMSGGTVAESLLKLYVGTSIKNAPSRGDVLTVNTDFISGGETLSTKSARASFDYLSEILYREKEWRTKTVKYMVDQFGAPLPEF